VVEDDRGVREHLMEMLADMHYLVLAAENAEKALELVADCSWKIDLLLTDVVMPGRMASNSSTRRSRSARPCKCCS
jgi:two-component system, NtrC family, sensor kinase